MRAGTPPVRIRLRRQGQQCWDAAVAADSSEGGHGDVPLEIMMKYADTNEKQDVCIEALRDRKQVSRVHSNSVGRDAFKASGLAVPTL